VQNNFGVVRILIRHAVVPEFFRRGFWFRPVCSMHMKYIFSTLLIALASWLTAAEPTPPRPNILYLVADDLGCADVGFQGCKDIATPNLDSLAENGVRFTNGYISASVCSPSRAGLITGRYQTRFGHEFNPSPGPVPAGLPAGQKTAADWFKAAGYSTAHIGKWHIGDAIRGPSAPVSRGFIDSIMSPGQNKIQPLIAFRNGKRETPDDKYVDLAMGREAATYIEQHKTHPWFLFVAFLTPHAPLDVPSEAEAPFAGITNAKRRKNAAMISLLDQSVGRILKALRDSGQEDGTLIVFHSDNGAPPGDSYNTPLRGFKSTLLEGGIRTPFVMQWKGTLPSGRVVDTPVISLDVLPTVLAAANVPVAADAKLDGVNLLPFLTGKTKEPPQRNLYWRYGEQYAIRQGDWKLVHSMERVANPPVVKTGLYNLAEDLAEERDLSTEHPEKAKALKSQWDEWNAQNVSPLWSPESNNQPSQSIATPKK
jgi:arylsulfatase A-like enzyme